MPWQLVGTGRKAAPALDPSDAEYTAFWTRVLDITAQYIEAVAQPDETQHHLSQLPDHQPLRRFPNCALFGLGLPVAAGVAFPLIERTFLYVPLVRIALNNEQIYRYVLKKITLPRSGTNESWYPVPIEELPDDADRGGSLHYRIYKLIVLRVVLMLRCIKEVLKRRTPETHATSVVVEQSMYHWLDAHLMMMIAIEQLGFVPNDYSEPMRILLERYAPDVHMAMCENELPDISASIERASFFKQSADARKDDPFVYTISKALPHRCEVREAAFKVAEVASGNSGYFDFIKIALAASFLGLYRRNNYRAGWRMRFAIYRLFFFTLDRRLLRYCVSKRLPDGTLAPCGGTAASMEHDFNLHQLCDGVLNPSSTKGRQRAVETNARMQYTSYTSFVASKYTAMTSPAAAPSDDGGGEAPTARSRNKVSATDMRARATRALSADYKLPPAPPISSLADVPSDARLPDNIESAEQLIAAGFFQQRPPVDVNAFCNGIFAANAMARQMYERACGVDYYNQRLASGTLPNSGITLADGTTPPPPPPVERGGPLVYKDVVKQVLPCDRVLPSEEGLQRDSIIYHWMSTLVLRDKLPKGSKAARDSDDDGERAEEEYDDDAVEVGGKKAKKSVEREYLFQNTINLAVREYLIYALQRWSESLRHELFGRIAWASWEESVTIAGDQLRRRLDELYVNPKAPLGAFITTYAPYHQMAVSARSRPLNTHYMSEKEHFLSALKRLMKSHVNAGYGDTGVDVVPTETEVLIQHLLQHWHYPRVAPPLPFSAVPQKPTTAASTASTSTTAPVFERYHEHINVPQLVYLIEPVAARLPPEIVGDTEAIVKHIKTEYVARGRFPLGVFHASAEMLHRFAATRMSYHISPSDTVVKEFVEWLGTYSSYDFYLLLTYCRSIERYMEIHTFPLPRHVAEHQLRTLRAQYCVPDDQPAPPHLMRSLVCTGCKRSATVIPKPSQRHSAMAVGNDEVRFIPRTDDDIVFEKVKARGCLPLPFSEIGHAGSWTEVLRHRSQPSAVAYDRWCGADSDETPVDVLEHPERYNEMPIEPTSADLDAFADQLFANTFTETNLQRFAQPSDRRETIYECVDDPRDKPVRLVARGKGRIGELAFDRAMWDEVNRRMMIYNGGGPNKERSHMLLGHSIEGADTKNYSTVRWSDMTQRIKAESKKTKQAAIQQQQIATIVDPEKRAQRVHAINTKRRRDAVSMARFALCARRSMFEIDFCGRALRAAALYAAGRSTPSEDDCIVACCDCLARMWTTQAYPIADRIVCYQCYVASKNSGGAVAQRAVRGESTKVVSATTLPVQNTEGVNHTRTTVTQKQISPSFSTLTSEVVPAGTCCIMDYCQAHKTEDQRMYGYEVLLDTQVGNETFAHVYLCAKHARMYARVFRLTQKLPFSALKLFMMQNRKDFVEVSTRGNYLDDVMRRAAHASGIGTQARADENIKRQRAETTLNTRKQRKAAKDDSSRAQAVARSAVVRKRKAPTPDIDERNEDDN